MLSLDLRTFIFTVINVLVLVFFLYRFLFKPVREILAARQNELDNSYREAEEANQKANALKKQYEDTMAQVDAERQEKLEKTRLQATSEYDEIIGNENFVVLSGPSHAEEVSKKMPTTIVSSSKNKEIAETIQHIFSNDYFRVYTNSDLIGVELGGALKNIIALGSGICDAVGYGDNTKAGIITRGIHEIARLGVKMGANPLTFSGLTGIGDLIVTCTSAHSRNKRAGAFIAQGYDIDKVQEKVGMAVEGIFTTLAGYELSREYDVAMPITEAIYNVIYNSQDIKQCVKSLMNRDKKSELLSEDNFVSF